MTNFDKLVSKLSELFELEKADLDFGIHRIIKARQKHIRIFLGLDQPAADDPNAPTLQKIVQREMGELNTVDLERQLENLTADIQSDYGRRAFEDGKLADGPAKDSEQGQLWMELQEQLDSGTVEANLQLEAEIYSHLTEFFARYYDEADFLSKRRIKAGDAPYAVPYSGEEVMLHWANKDQYYIKSSKDLKDYTFTLPERFGEKRVQFKCERQDPVLNNNKAKREFHIDDEAEIEIGEDHIVIPFHFKIVDKTRTQKDTKEWIEGIVAQLPADWQQAIQHKPEGAANDLITRHLSNYTRKNESDFFIHKHLGKFLRGELDFYIKNEVMHLDDIDAKSTDYLATRVRLIKALRTIALHIITFLAQLENFQKKLWLKKKYVTETNYCITLDRIFDAPNAEQLTGAVLEHLETKIRRYDGELRSQQDEWIKLYAIDEIEDYPEDGKLTKDFLKAHDKLMLDTVFYPDSFKWKLLSGIDDLEESLGGLLIQSDNFQALNILREQYRRQVKSIYIDPPYNAPSSEILYKNQFKHSSWVTFLNQLLNCSKELETPDSVLVIAIDENEVNRLGMLISQTRSDKKNVLVTIIHNPGGIQGTNFSNNNEFAYFSYKNSGKQIAARIDTDADETPLRDWGGDTSLRETAANCFYPIIITESGVIEFIGQIVGDDYHPSANEVLDDGRIAIYPIDSSGVERKWRTSEETCRTIIQELRAVKQPDGDWAIKRKKDKFVHKTTWTQNEFNANTYGSKLLNKILGKRLFDYPKAIGTVERCINASLNEQKNGIILDYFAGSGTTGHAVLNLNRDDSGNRKYILVEMGEHFDNVVIPRIVKTAYSKEWDDGKPTSPETSISQCFKYIRLESYEDALNNLDLGEDRTPDLLGLGDQVREDYLFSYLLDVETRGHLMNLQRFRDPWGCQLKIHDPHTGKAEPKVIDLVETFNYLLGVTVREVKVQDGFLTLEGESPSGETVLIVWRKLEGESDWPTTDNEALKTFITERRRINTAATEYHAIYINGDHTLEDPLSKIHCIEEEFYERMFENTGNPED